jgi:hypothetical protein
MLLNVLLRLVPTKLNAEMAATAINAAISAYSIAVTPDWSSIRFEKNVRNSQFPHFLWDTRINCKKDIKKPQRARLLCASRAGASQCRRANRDGVRQPVLGGQQIGSGAGLRHACVIFWPAPEICDEPVTALTLASKLASVPGDQRVAR